MKVFVYSKVTSSKIAIIRNVVGVSHSGNNFIVFTTSAGETFTFNTREVKTTTYQN